MASPGQLVTVLASTLNVPEATIAQIDRRLAESGLRTKAGRGRSAARVTSQDAANLLLAIMGAPISGSAIIDAVETCRLFGNMECSTKLEVGKDLAAIGLRSMASLPPEHTLALAVARLIDGIASGESLLLPSEEHNVRSFSFHVVGPSRMAAFSSVSSDSKGSHQVQLSYRPPPEQRSSEPKRGDMWQERIVSIATFEALAQTIGPGGTVA